MPSEPRNAATLLAGAGYRALWMLGGEVLRRLDVSQVLERNLGADLLRSLS